MKGTNYGKDQCTDENFEKEALALFGCTTPFGPNKDLICNETENATKVNDMYMKWYSNKIQVNSGCNEPCSYVTIRMTTIWEKPKKYKTISRAIIYFKEKIKVTKAYHMYSGLTLIAEIGGYVGLFLGVSINQLTNLLDVFILQIKKY